MGGRANFSLSESRLMPSPGSTGGGKIVGVMDADKTKSDKFVMCDLTQSSNFHNLLSLPMQVSVSKEFPSDGIFPFLKPLARLLDPTPHLDEQEPQAPQVSQEPSGMSLQV